MPEITLVKAIRAATLAAYAPPLSFVLSRALVSSSLVAFQVSIQSRLIYSLSFWLSCAFIVTFSPVQLGIHIYNCPCFFSQVTRFVCFFP